MNQTVNPLTRQSAMLLLFLKENAATETRKTYITYNSERLDGALRALHAQGVPGRRTIGQMRDIVDAAYGRLVADSPETPSLADFVNDQALIAEFANLSRYNRHVNNQALRLLDVRAADEIMAAANEPIRCAGPDCIEPALDDDDLCASHAGMRAADQRERDAWLAASVHEILAREGGS